MMTKSKIISAVSKRYADALTKTALEIGKADYFIQELNEICEVLNSSQDLNIVMANSSVSIKTKQEITEDIFCGKIDKKLLNFLKILIEKNRFYELESIKTAYEKNIEKISNIKTVEITSPIELDTDNKSKILSKLEQKLNCEIKTVWKLDETLIAGLTFKYDDCIIDTSIRTKLENLSKNITG